MRLAAAPISWGVCEVPGWGYQLDLDRVLDDAARLDLHATEAGPPGFLPDDAREARDAVGRHGMHVIGGFVTAVLHRPERLDAELAALDARASWLAGLGAEVLVLAAATGRDGYDAAVTPSTDEFRALFEALPRAVETARRRGLVTALHPHVGTLIETRDAIERVLRESDVPLCLDTGHVFVGGADPVAIARAYPRRIRHVHLKDADARLAAAVRERRLTYIDAVKRGLFRPLGDGDARSAETLAMLKGAAYRGWAVLEQDIALASPPTEANDPARDVARSRDFALAHA